MIPVYKVKGIRVHIGVQVGRAVETSVSMVRHKMKEIVDQGEYQRVRMIDERAQASYVPYTNISQILLDTEWEEEESREETPKRGRGRPPKISISVLENVETTVQDTHE